MLFQFTLPCGERQSLIKKEFQLLKISIHAPVWGATKYDVKTFIDTNISIHAPVWGATNKLENMINYYTISIHAPVWGATKFKINYE